MKRRSLYLLCLIVSVTILFSFISAFLNTNIPNDEPLQYFDTNTSIPTNLSQSIPAHVDERAFVKVDEEREIAVVDSKVEEESSWLYNNLYVVRNKIVATDTMPHYFDLSSADMVPQFIQYHNDTKEIMESRKNKIKLLCRYKGSRLKDPLHFLYHFKDMSLSWCPCFKCGSTNWKQFFCKHYRPRDFRIFNNDNLKLYCPLESLQVFVNKDDVFRETVDKSIKFLTVRHPYERLVSLYKEKLEDCNSDFYTSSLMMRILKRYRGLGNTSVLDRDSYLAEARDECFKLKEDRVINPKNPFMNPMGVTFREFVQHITNEMRSLVFKDLHWTPITRGCDLCITKYDVIQKFETLERDHYYLFTLLGKQHFYGDIAQAHYNHIGTTVQDLEKYFATLNENLLYNLYVVYRDDFDLFNYKPHFVAKSRYL